MNTTIDSLARTAMRITEKSFGDRWSSIGRADFMSKYNHVYAKLIVEECMWCVDECESEMHYDSGMVPIIGVNTRIKQHFGIE